MVERAAILKGRPPSQFVGGWEAGLLGLMALLYIAGALINPAFFGTTDARMRCCVIFPLRRHGRGHDLRYRQQDIDLSVGSTSGLSVLPSRLSFSPDL
jgi:ribose transport system permease protein